MGNLQKLKYAFKETDWLTIIPCLLASAFGILMVHSATLYKLTSEVLISRDTKVMIIAAGIGIVLGIIVSFIDYDIITRLWPLVAVVSLGLMFSLFIWGEGTEERPDAICWLEIGSFNFQPSELVKIGFIITFSVHINTVKEDISSIKNVLLLCIHAVIPAGLVILTDDLGSALVFIIIFLVMMFIAGLSIKYFLVAAVACIAAVPVLWFSFLSSFHKNRILAIYYPKALDQKVYEDIIYQQQRGLYALGSGKFTGHGLFNGPLTQDHEIPVNESDMLFTTIGEELGFLGCLLTLVIISVIVLRAIYNGRTARTSLGSLLCYGTAAMIIAQSIINIGMCLQLLPSIGITLPFFSSGGSSNLCIYLGIGLIMSVYRFSQDREPVKLSRLRHISTPFS